MTFLAQSGCDVMGVVAYKVVGPPDVPAKFVMAKQPTLVMVENYQHQSAAAAPSDVLARFISAEFETRQLVPVIPPEKLQELRDARPAEYGKMSITAIGRHVGAAQIVYVQLLSSDVTPIAGGEGFIGQASASVKVVHVESGQTLWPTDQTDGYGIAVSSKSPQSRAPTAADVRRDLNAKLTDEISRLFRKWKPDDMAPESMNL